MGILLVDDHKENLSALRGGPGAAGRAAGQRRVRRAGAAGAAARGHRGHPARRPHGRAWTACRPRASSAPGPGRATSRSSSSPPRSREVEEIALAYASGAVDYVDQAVRARDPARQGRRCSSSSAASAESACASPGPALRPRRWRAPCARCRSSPTRRSRTWRCDGLTAELVERAATLFQADSACLLLRDENAPGLGVHAARGALPVTRQRPGDARRGHASAGSPSSARRRCWWARSSRLPRAREAGREAGEDAEEHREPAGGPAGRRRRAAGADRARRHRRGPLRRRRPRAAHARRRPDGDRHRPRPALRRTGASWWRPSSAACCRTACRITRAWSSPRATCPAGWRPRSAGTGMTRSSSTAIAPR